MLKRVGSPTAANRIVPTPKPGPELSRAAKRDPSTPNHVWVTPSTGGPHTQFTLHFQVLLTGAFYHYTFTGTRCPQLPVTTGGVGGGDIRGQLWSDQLSAGAGEPLCGGTYHVSVAVNSLGLGRPLKHPAKPFDDVRLPARKGTLRILGKGQRLREVPVHPQLRSALNDWLAERSEFPASAAALFLNRRGERLSVRGAHAVITGIAARGGLDDRVSAHVLRHSFATTLVRGGTDLVIAAELLGHARLETTRVYTRPSAEDRRKAIALLPVDE
ncbi:MAG: tyrosine-type recombinase/integrase [Solirubrobacteraceae bacterium]